MNSNNYGDKCVMPFLEFSENSNHTALSARNIRKMTSQMKNLRVDQLINTRTFNGDSDYDADYYLERKQQNAATRAKNRREKKKASKARALKEFNDSKPKKASMREDTEFDLIMRDCEPQALFDTKQVVTINIVERLLAHAVIFGNITSKVALAAQLTIMFNDLTGLNVTDVIIQSKVIPHLLSFMGSSNARAYLERDEYDRAEQSRYSEEYDRLNPNWEEEQIRSFPERDCDPQDSEGDPILKLGGFLADSLQTVCGGDDVKLSNSILWNKFVNVCQYICMAPILLSMGLINKVEDWNNFRSFVTSGLSNIKGVMALVDFVKECKTSIAEYFSLPVEMRSLAVFFKADKLSRWSSEVLEFCNFVHDKDWITDKFDKGDAKASRHTIVSNAVRWGDEQYNIGKRLHLNAKFESRWSGVYASLLTRLSSLIIDLKGELANGRIRPMPFSILIYGEPGIMKSRFTHATLDVLAHVYGIENVPGNIYVRNSGAKHHDGAQGGQRMWLFDDIAQEVANMAEGSLVADLIGGINTISPLLNMASLKDKAITTCDAEVVVGTTNVKDLQAAAYFKAPAAALRRFPYVVTLEIKPEFKDKDGVMLRNDIAFEDDDLERWLITVEEVIVVTKVTVKYRMIINRGTSVEYFAWLLKTATHWKNKQQGIHNAFMTREKRVCKHGYPGTRCPSCKNEGIVVRRETKQYDEFRESLFCKVYKASELSSFEFKDLMEHKRLSSIIELPLVECEEIVLSVPQWGRVGLTGPNSISTRWTEWIDYFITPPIETVVGKIAGGWNFLWFNFKLFAALRRWITWETYKSLVWCSDDTPVGMIRRSLLNVNKPTVDAVWLHDISSYTAHILVILGGIGLLWKIKSAIHSRNEEMLKDTLVESKDGNYVDSNGNLYSKDKGVPQGHRLATKEEIDAVAAFSAKLGLPKSSIPIIRVTTARKWDNNVPKRELNSLKLWADPMWQAKFSRCLETNIVDIRCIDDQRNVSSFKGIFVSATGLLIPGHCCPSKGEFIISWGPGTVNARCIKIQVTPSVSVQHSSKDLAMVFVSANVAAKKIINSFIEKPIQMFSGLPLSVVEVDNEEKITRAFYPTSQPVTARYTAHKVFKENVYEYVGADASRFGKCGAVAVGELQGKHFLLGIHISGEPQNSRGNILPVYQSDIIEMSSKFPSTPSLPDDDDYLFNGVHREELSSVPEGHVMSKFLEPSGIAILGCIKTGHTGIAKSEVVATPLQVNYDSNKVFGPPRFGGFMHEGEWVSNTENKLKTIMEYDYSMDPELNRVTSKVMVNRALERCDFSQCGPLSLEETISGVDGSIINAINDSTSPGQFLTGKKRDHTAVLNMLEPNKKIPSEKLVKSLDTIIGRYKLGLSAMYTFGWADKDEPIKQTKTLSGGTRIFNPSPLCLLILMRMFFEPIAAELLKNPHKFPHKIGINAVSKDWDKIVRSLVEPSAGFHDGTLEPTDQKSYDSRTEIYMALLDFVDIARTCPLYTPEHIQLMEMLAYDASHAFVQVQSAIVQTPITSLSGFWQTALINSWVLEKAEFEAYLIAARKHLKFLGTWDVLLVMAPDFYEVCRLVLYGDDTIINKHQRILGWYTTKARVDAFKILGFVVTSDVKGEEPSQKPLSQCSFLKRSFRYDLERERWACPLEMASIYKSLAWEMGHPTLSDSEYMTALCDNAEREFFQHGRETFDLQTTLLRKNLSEAPLSWQPTHKWRTYDQMRLLTDEQLFTKDM